MPTYEFVCRDCDKPFTAELTEAQYDRRDVRCPACESRRIDRIWSAPAVPAAKR